MGIAEVDLDIRRQCESLVAGHFLTPVPRQRFVKFVRQLASVFDQGVGDGPSIFARELDQHQVARLTFDQRGNLAVVAATQLVTFPVPWYGSIVSRRGPFADGDGIDNPAVIVSLLCVIARATHASRPPQIRQQLLLQSTSGLNIEGAIDGLV